MNNSKVGVNLLNTLTGKWRVESSMAKRMKQAQGTDVDVCCWQEVGQNTILRTYHGCS